MQASERNSGQPMHTGSATPRTFEDLTVIVPTVGRPILEKCLQSIANGTVRPARVLVVDQGSNPVVRDWLRELNTSGLATTHLVSSGRSPASARNDGLRAVQTHFVAATDDDCLVASDWLENMEQLLRANPTAIVTGRLEPAGEGIPPTVVTSMEPRIHTRPSMKYLSPLQTANMGFARATAQRVGPFDEFLRIAEDNDWGYRALRAGVSIVYAPALRVDHYHWRDDAQMVAQYRLYARDQGVFYGRHLRRGDWSMIMRIAISQYRGTREWLKGLISNNHENRVNGYARTTRLVPGVLAGLRGPVSK